MLGNLFFLLFANAVDTGENLPAWGRAIEAAVQAKDSETLKKSISAPQFAQRILDGMPLKGEARTKMQKILDQQIPVVLPQLLRALTLPESYHFLRVTQLDKEQVLLFRVLMEDGQLNYHYWMVKKVAGQLQGIDFLPANSGQWISENMAQNFMDAVGKQSAEQPLGSDLKKLQQAKALNQEGKPAEAIAIIDNILPGLQNKRMYLLNKIEFASAIGRDKHNEAIREYLNLYGQEGTLALHLLDYYGNVDDYPHMLETVNAFDKTIGGDPYLNFHRFFCAQAMGEYAKAQGLAGRFVADFPEDFSVYYLAMASSIQNKNDGDAAAWLKKILATFEVEIEPLMEDFQDSEFIHSQAYLDIIQP
ncbi:MAG: hypothetical protein KDC71_18740 [Acidobacteria bacterium]|nr:hypothetical protein [Acidobacteriota bacterium]